MGTDIIVKIWVVIIPIIFGVLAGFFLIIGLRGMISKRAFLISNRWLLWMMFIIFVPVILQGIFLPSSTPFLVKWVNPVIFTVVLVMMCLVLKGYAAYGVTDVSFRESLLTSLDKLQFPYEETLSTVRLPSIEADLQISIQSWIGAGMIKIKQREQRSVLTQIVTEMNKHFQLSSAPINLTSCIFYLVMGVIIVIAGIGMVVLFQNIIAKM